MVGSISAQVALLAFAAAILAGLYAGNSPVTVLTRALVALLVALLVGKLASWAIKQVWHDHVQRKQLAAEGSGGETAAPSEPAGSGQKPATAERE